MRLELDLLAGSYSALGSWPPVQQNRFRIIRASFEVLEGMLRAARQLYTTNVPPDMRVVRVFGHEPVFVDLGRGQARGILTVLVASAGFEALPPGQVPPAEIPEMDVKIMTYYDPRAFLDARSDEAKVKGKGERMKEIWKYQIPIPGAGSFTLEVPEGAQFLTCQIQDKVPVIQVQDKAPVLWALVKTTARKREYKFHVFGTGESFELHDDLTYIGTFQLGGAFIFVGHLFVQGATKL